MLEELTIVFTPWRWGYIKSFHVHKKEGECVLCEYVKGHDDGLVVYKGNECFIVMNKFPYVKGHVLIVTNRHVSSLADLTEGEIEECSLLLTTIVKAMERVLGISYHDVCAGINMGRVAGAGIEGHFHIHVIPMPGTTWFSSDDPATVEKETKEVAKALREEVVRALGV